MQIPFFEFPWQVDSRATRTVIEHFWNAHIQDWKTLDINRHGAHVPMRRLLSPDS